MMDFGCSPLRADFQITERSEARALVTMTVRHSEPVLSGHYPGFPILPGVCVIEQVRRGALATIPAPGRWVMAEIANARFLGPVFPGDFLTAELGWTQHWDDSWWCAAVAATQRGIAARTKIRFAAVGAP
jgi:3-hydroxyacyl-[acyl-carrier-protein] dehydratase